MGSSVLSESNRVIEKCKGLIPSIAYEPDLLNYLPFCFRVLEEIDANAPVAILPQVMMEYSFSAGEQDYGLCECAWTPMVVPRRLPCRADGW